MPLPRFQTGRTVLSVRGLLDRLAAADARGKAGVQWTGLCAGLPTGIGRRRPGDLVGATAADAGGDGRDRDAEPDSRALAGGEEACGRHDVDGRTVRRQPAPTAPNTAIEQPTVTEGAHPAALVRAGTGAGAGDHAGRDASGIDWRQYEPAVRRLGLSGRGRRRAAGWWRAGALPRRRRKKAQAEEARGRQSSHKGQGKAAQGSEDTGGTNAARTFTAAHHAARRSRRCTCNRAAPRRDRWFASSEPHGGYCRGRVGEAR